MESPQDCPDEFYAVMNDCWRKEAKDRPSFAELSERIGEIIERHASEVSSKSMWRRIGLLELDFFRDHCIHDYWFQRERVFDEQTYL